MESGMDHFQLTTEQQFSVRAMEESRGSLQREDILTLLKDAKKLLKVKSRYAENPRDLSCLSFSIEDQLSIQVECHRLAEDKSLDELFDELVWCNKLIMIKDNHIRKSLKAGVPNSSISW